MRASDGVIYGLDFPAVLSLAEHLDLDLPLVAEILPFIEPHVVTAWRREEEP